MTEQAHAELTLRDNAQATALLGQYNRNLNEIQKAFDAQILARGEMIRIDGEPEEVEQVRGLFEKLLDLVQGRHVPSLADVRYLIAQIKAGSELDGVLSDIHHVLHWPSGNWEDLSRSRHGN